MADHPNAELIRKGYDAFIAGDIEWLNEHLHENIVWHEPGNSVLSGDYRGREEVLAHFAKVVARVVPEFDIHDVVANEDHAVALVSTRATRQDNGETYEGRFVHIFHVANGRALESWTYWEDPAGNDAFLAGLT